ncbi:MAG: glycosyltransferase family 4 protein [Ruminococcus sp.]|nr:glycosyltransferase family 4 protein [Ruminococcus sp.]
MKVLVYTKQFPRPDNETFGPYVYSQISKLIEQGVEVKIVSPHTYIPKCFAFLGGKIKRYANAQLEYEYKGIKVLSPAFLWSKYLFNFSHELKYAFYKKSMYSYMLHLCKEFKPDVIYSLDPLLDGRLNIEVGKKLGIPVVLIEHSIPNNYKNLVGNKKAVSIYSNAVKAADKTIFVTNIQKQRFDKMVGFEINGTIIYNGFVNENQADVCKPFSYTKDRLLRTISVGFLEAQKGYPIIFKALKTLREQGADISSVIVGDGKSRQEYEQVVNDYGLGDVCTFKGIVKHDEVLRLMSESDVFVLPSYQESFGIVYLEAMSCGLPVIATKGEGISDIVVDGENGFLIEKNNADELYDRLEFIRNNPEATAKIANKGFQTAKELTWDKNAEQTIKVFEQVINR